MRFSRELELIFTVLSERQSEASSCRNKTIRLDESGFRQPATFCCKCSERRVMVFLLRRSNFGPNETIAFGLATLLGRLMNSKIPLAWDYDDYVQKIRFDEGTCLSVELWPSYCGDRIWGPSTLSKFASWCILYVRKQLSEIKLNSETMRKRRDSGSWSYFVSRPWNLWNSSFLSYDSSSSY